MPRPAAKREAGSRVAILSAAEAAFAEHGFSGARVDDIAKSSGFNKTLIFRHFGDKLGLYTEVLKRVDKEIGSLQARNFAPLIRADDLGKDPEKFRSLLRALAETTFDYMVEHPSTLKILNWEAAKGWKTFSRIASVFLTEDLTRMEVAFHRAWRAGSLRSNFHPLIQLSMVSQICVSYLASVPVFQLLVPGEDLVSAKSLSLARKFVVEAVVYGMAGQ